jgi:hypothetical protein
MAPKSGKHRKEISVFPLVVIEMITVVASLVSPGTSEKVAQFLQKSR